MKRRFIIVGAILGLTLLTQESAHADERPYRSYSSCNQLIKDFPDGIAQSPRNRTAAVTLGYRAPSVQPAIFKKSRARIPSDVRGVLCASKIAGAGSMEAPATPDPALEALAAQVASVGASCLVVLREGRLAGEWYWQGRDRNTQTTGFSTMKAVTATLIGIANRKGLLSLDQPASDFIAEWRGTPSSGVTIRHLLSMTSGREIRPEDDYALVFYQDPTAYAIGLGQPDVPGTVWRNSNSAVQTLARVLTKATGQTVPEFAKRELLSPLGMNSTTLVADGAGGANLAFNYLTTCRDLSQLVQLYMDRGVRDGRRILNEQFVSEALTPSSRFNPGYGLLNRLNTPGVPGFNPRLPNDAFDFLGLCGQVGRGVPSQRVVMAAMVTADLLSSLSCDPRGRVMESMRSTLVAP